MIKIAIVDDQKLMLEGLSIILSNDENIEVVGTASNGQEAYDFCRNNRVDVVLMDIKMPFVNGVEAVKMIKRDFPYIKIIMLTTFNDDDYIFDSLKYGASGYLLKDASADEIIEAIKTVINGGAMIEPKTANKVLKKFIQLAKDELTVETINEVEALTPRENDICKLVAEGKNNKEIAEELFLSEGTVKNNLSTILQKLQLRDRTQLAIYVLKNK